MSPEVCIEPDHLLIALVGVELLADLVLTQSANGKRQGVTNGGIEHVVNRWKLRVSFRTLRLTSVGF